MGILNETKEKLSGGVPPEMKGMKNIKIDDLKKIAPVRVLITGAKPGASASGEKAVWISFRLVTDPATDCYTWTASGGVPEQLLSEAVQSALAVAPLPSKIEVRKSTKGFSVLSVIDDE